MKTINEILDASSVDWIKGLLAASVTGVGSALAGLVVGMSTHAILQMTGLQALIHVGLYLQNPKKSDRN
jgi:hypothetical protein